MDSTTEEVVVGFADTDEPKPVAEVRMPVVGDKVRLLTSRIATITRINKAELNHSQVYVTGPKQTPDIPVVIRKPNFRGGNPLYAWWEVDHKK